ncbi:MAG: hypothetical protein N3G21_04265 [Candidatus Hydrogenedentes bacterium]|nr:hypothetical protein [Candidatus Hydrogenedentota bacterium]
MGKAKFLTLYIVFLLSGSMIYGHTDEQIPLPPPEFTQIQTVPEEELGKTITEFLWYHLYKRLGNGPTIFNKEYLLTADTWVNGFVEPYRNKPIQEVHREDLLSIQIDEEGYINSHQHFSHAHDWGWPFPIWTQTMGESDKGIGWHFQPLEKVPGWVGDSLRHDKNYKACGEEAILQWTLENLKSNGIVNNSWELEVTGDYPTIISPNLSLTAKCIPYFQIRWKREPTLDNPSILPYIEWQREKDEGFSSDRRMYFYPEKTHLSAKEWFHSIIPLYTHPLWEGKIKKIRFCLYPGKCSGKFYIDSIFSVFDTRHTINNPIYILACRLYFNWTGDIEFLNQVINKMRMALLYQMKVLGGEKYNCIVNPWIGHDGLPGFSREGNKKKFAIGHGIGNNYWDLLPFGGYDCYATNQYYASILAMAEIEKAVLQHPEWNIPRGALALEPEKLIEHAEKVKLKSQEIFWDRVKGRFIGCIDLQGNRHDYGFTFLNLDAIWYGIASDAQSKEIMAWINGERLVEGDTSQGRDIYRWRFGPRATTLRNEDWYVFCWTHPENIPWGKQVQDGGAVLGFSFYDLWARLNVLSPENAWERLKEIVIWESEVRKAGGYRKYYEKVNPENTLQGCNTPGGLGIDCEFFESSLLPSILIYGFLGISPRPDKLVISPKIPNLLEKIIVKNLRYRNSVLCVSANKQGLEIDVTEMAKEIVLKIEFEKLDTSTGERKSIVNNITSPGKYQFSSN